MKVKLIRLVAFVGLSLLIIPPVQAELPLIRLDRIFPLGGQAGAATTLDITGRDLEDVHALHFDHPGFKAELVKANQFRVVIAVDVPSGTYEVRAVGKFGISGVRLFAVSHGLTEVRETEPNDSPEKAQKVALNSAINGQSDGNGDDFIVFAAKKGQRLTIDCQGYRLDSTLRAILTLSTADGKDLLQSKPFFNRTDPFLDFMAPADGDYVIRLHDMTFLGGLPYRLIISDHPHVENAFPAAVTPGEKTTLTLLGRNLPGSLPSRGDTNLEQVSLPVTIPAEPVSRQTFAFRNHLPSPNLNARGLQLWPAELKNAVNPITLFYADAPVTREQESNDTPETSQAVTLPMVIGGRFDRSGDADWYTFTAKTGDMLAIDLLCERLDFPGDPFVILLDAKGAELTTLDDHGINSNALAQFNRDPLGTFRIPSDGHYRLVVQERYRQGGARYQYVLRLGKATPDFFPLVCHETPNEPSCPLVRQGGSAFYQLCLNRRDYSGPVTIEADGLPTGVSCPSVHVSPQSQFANIVFTAAADAPAWSGAIRLKAVANIDGSKIEREVRCCQRRWAIANINTSVVVRQICLAVRDSAPYSLQLPKELAVPAGGTLDVALTGKRLWPDFQGAIQVTGLNLPPGFGFANITLPVDKSAVQAKLTVAANVPPGNYTINVRGDAQVPYNRDAKAATRPNVRVAEPSTALTVVVGPALKK